MVMPDRHAAEPSTPVAQIATPPVRLCCLTRHFGPLCPDGRFMCCMCFDRFTLADASVEPDGQKVDVCWPCAWYDGPAQVLAAWAAVTIGDAGAQRVTAASVGQ
jgi:hypothetical protein